jgi:CobQ-like glutamine amidotransferase family enzyme
MSGESAVRIALLLPDALGTYSDRGNATVLAQRLRWRGIPAEVLEVTADTTPPTDCEVFLLGGGEDAAQWLIRHRPLRTAMQTRQVLAVCAGLQVLGQWMEGLDGRRVAGAEILDISTMRLSRVPWNFGGGPVCVRLRREHGEFSRLRRQWPRRARPGARCGWPGRGCRAAGPRP